MLGSLILYLKGMRILMSNFLASTIEVIGPRVGAHAWRLGCFLCKFLAWGLGVRVGFRVGGCRL